MTGSLLATWQLKAERDSTAFVVPDGCRDLILKRSRGEKPFWFLSSLEDRTYSVAIDRGDIYTGYRLKPGTIVNEDRLLTAVQGEVYLHEEVCFRLENFTTISDPLNEALTCLASGIGSVAGTARQLGLSQRNLQRLVLRGTGKPPVFWLQLARVRRAGRAVNGTESLAEIAYAYGYADQSHMTRDFKRWLDISPAALRTGAMQRRQLHESGFA